MSHSISPSTEAPGGLAASSEAPLVPYHGAQMPAWYSSAIDEHRAVRTAAGLFDFSFRSIFSAEGSDRGRFLHNMTTNDVKGLTPGLGLYAAMLDVRGHILADLEILCDEDRFLVSTDADLLDKVLTMLGRYNIGGRVPIDTVSLTVLSVQGPKAAAIVEDALRAPSPGPEEFCHAKGSITGQAVRVIKTSSTGEEGYELWVAPEVLTAVRDFVLEIGREHGLIRCGSAALETLRIEAGIPEYGSELGEDTLPLEAGLMTALSFNKGCYIGQEIVERARSRGRVNWKLAGFFFESPAPPLVGEQLLAEGKPMGEITSACVSPTLERTIALGYVRREVVEPGTRLELASGGAAVVTTLPFYRRA